MTPAELVVLWRALVDKTRAEPWFDGRAERIACFDTAAEQLEAALRAQPAPSEERVEAAEWTDPTPEELASPEFGAIWQVIKSWDIGVSGAYRGYCGATGNHVVAILRAARAALRASAEPTEAEVERALDAWLAAPESDSVMESHERAMRAALRAARQP